MTDKQKIELPDSLTIANVQPLQEQLEKLVDDKGHDHIQILASKVQRADTAGIQLLYAFIVSAKERRLRVAWDKPSEQLCSAAQVLGMATLLGIH